MLTRLSQLQQALVEGGAEQLAELSRKITAGEPVVLGPSKAWVCLHCGFHQPDTEFANGVIWRSEPQVPMGEHINQLHNTIAALAHRSNSLQGRVEQLVNQMKDLKKKARQKQASMAPVTGRATSRGRRVSRKGST